MPHRAASPKSLHSPAHVGALRMKINRYHKYSDKFGFGVQCWLTFA